MNSTTSPEPHSTPRDPSAADAAPPPSETAASNAGSPSAGQTAAALLATPPAGAASAPKKRLPVSTLVLGGLVALAAAFGGGVAVGRATAPQPAAFGPDRGGQQFNQEGMPPSGEGGMRLPGGGFGVGSTSGTVASIDGDSITLRLEDGSEVQVQVTDETQITDLADLSVGDLQAGDAITVRPNAAGQDEDSGDITAQSITRGDLETMAWPGGAGGPVSRR